MTSVVGYRNFRLQSSPSGAINVGATMALRTRLTDFFKIKHPIVLAPMDPASGGELAAAVSAAGGLGLIGGGYGNREFLETEFAKVGNQRVGCGFIIRAPGDGLGLRIPGLLNNG